MGGIMRSEDEIRKEIEETKAMLDKQIGTPSYIVSQSIIRALEWTLGIEPKSTLTLSKFLDILLSITREIEIRERPGGTYSVDRVYFALQGKGILISIQEMWDYLIRLESSEGKYAIDIQVANDPTLLGKDKIGYARYVPGRGFLYFIVIRSGR
jgi:hypothetical protein